MQTTRDIAQLRGHVARWLDICTRHIWRIGRRCEPGNQLESAADAIKTKNNEAKRVRGWPCFPLTFLPCLTRTLILTLTPTPTLTPTLNLTHIRIPNLILTPRLTLTLTSISLLILFLSLFPLLLVSLLLVCLFLLLVLLLLFLFLL